MDEDINVSVIVEQLKSAGTNLSQEVLALFRLGEWYLKKAKTTLNCADFTKANALYNAALVRCRRVDNEISEDHILRGIVETFREFLHAFAEDDRIGVDEVQNEIEFHKEFLAKERKIFKERLDKIDSRFSTNDPTDDKYEIHADKIYEVFRDIQDMFIRLVTMLVKECESRLGKPPCDYAIIALGSVASMEATPYSDLEFAILYSDPAIGDKVDYFRVLSHFLHLKVINLGETILPAMAIEELNDFQSSDPNSNWYYDSDTPRGISFDGAMPWASKTAIGRMATKNKPALELIKTPEEMAKFQDIEVAAKEGYHLAIVMSKAALLFGDQALLTEYNERVAEKLNAVPAKSTKTLGFTRGIVRMAVDVCMYDPQFSYLGNHCTVGAHFDAKKQFYRAISMLLSDLKLIFDIRYPSPWKIILELQTRGIISDSETTNMKVCLSIANEIRLKTYFANGGQKELLSPVPRHGITTEQSSEPPIFRYFDKNTLVRFLKTSTDINKRCHHFCLKYTQENEIDISLLSKPSVASADKASADIILTGTLYYRLQDFPAALEWLKSVPKDSPDYSNSLNHQGLIYNEYGEFEKSVKCFENALEVHYQNEENSKLNELRCLDNLGIALLHFGQYEEARITLEKTIKKQNEIYGKGFVTLNLSRLTHNLGSAYLELGDISLAVKTFKEAEMMQNEMEDVPEMVVIKLALSIAMALTELDGHAQSLEYVKQALHLSKKLFGEADLSSKLSQIYVDAASVYEHCNMSKEALVLYQRSLEVIRRIFGDSPHPGAVSCLNNIGNFFSRRYQTNKAIEFLENALKEARTVYSSMPNFDVALTLNNLGVALKRAERPEEALPYFQEAKDIMDKILGPNCAHPVTSDILNNMGTIYQDLGLLDKAIQCYKDVHKMNCVIYGANGVSDAMATACLNIACASEELGDFIQAKEYYIKAVEIDRKISSTRGTGLVSSLYGLSSICDALEEPEESLKHLEEAREIAKSAGSKNFMMATVLLELGMKYNEMGSTDEGKTCLHEAREIAESLDIDGPSPALSGLLELLNKD